MNIPARHPKKGDCTIRRVVHAHGRIKVSVDYTVLGLRDRHEFLDELIDPQIGKPIRLPEASLRTDTDVLPENLPVPQWHSARQSLQALRLGQSIPANARHLSVGMANTEAACRWALDRAATGQLSFLLFESTYGMGKSHALAYFRLLAHESAAATGTIVLDGVGTTLCQPLTLTAALAHNIEFPDERFGDGLPQRLARFLREGLVDCLRMPQGATLLYDCLCALRSETADDPDAWELIEDYFALEATAADVNRRLGVQIPALRTRALADRPGRAAELLRAWAQGITIMGARNGLVIMLDEADVDYAQSGRSESERGQRGAFLHALKSIADGGTSPPGYTKLVVAIAITPGIADPDPVDELKTELGDHLKTVKLAELSMNDLRALGGKVSDLYRSAYQVSDAQASVMTATVSQCLRELDRLSEERNPRKFIRLLLERLDVAHC